jgi:hypothetical protein
VLAGLLLFFFCGCAGYQLGPTHDAPAGSRSVQINLFQNNTWEPRLSEPVATALRRAVQRDGTYKLDTHGSGDIILDGVITEFRRSGVTFQPADVLTPRDYELTLYAKVKAIERGTGRVLIDSEVFGRTTIRSGPDLPSAERQAAPLLAEDMAQNIASLLVDGTW